MDFDHSPKVSGWVACLDCESTNRLPSIASLQIRYKNGGNTQQVETNS